MVIRVESYTLVEFIIKVKFNWYSSPIFHPMHQSFYLQNLCGSWMLNIGTLRSTINHGTLRSPLNLQWLGIYGQHVKESGTTLGLWLIQGPRMCFQILTKKINKKMQLVRVSKHFHLQHSACPSQIIGHLRFWRQFEWCYTQQFWAFEGLLSHTFRINLDYDEEVHQSGI